MQFLANLKKQLLNSHHRSGERNELHSCSDLPKDAKMKKNKVGKSVTLPVLDDLDDAGNHVFVPPLYSGDSTLDAEEPKGCLPCTKPSVSNSNSMSSIKSVDQKPVTVPDCVPPLNLGDSTSYCSSDSVDAEECKCCWTYTKPKDSKSNSESVIVPDCVPPLDLGDSTSYCSSEEEEAKGCLTYTKSRDSKSCFIGSTEALNNQSVTVITLDLNDTTIDAEEHTLAPPLDLGASTSNYSSGSATYAMDAKGTKGFHSISPIKRSTCDAARLTHTAHCHVRLEKMQQSVKELVRDLIDDNNKLREELECKTEQTRIMSELLGCERKRNKRLMKFIQRGDNSYESDDNDADCKTKDQENVEHTGSSDAGSSLRLSTIDSDCISPMLMQQRYEKLNVSYQHCRLQLEEKDKLLEQAMLEKDKLLEQAMLEKEESQAKYDSLLDSRRNLRKSFKEMRKKYSHLQEEQSAQLEMLWDAVHYASQSIFMAERKLEHSDCIDDKTDVKFKRYVKSFYKARNACEWTQTPALQSQTPALQTQTPALQIQPPAPQTHHALPDGGKSSANFH